MSSMVSKSIAKEGARLAAQVLLALACLLPALEATSAQPPSAEFLVAEELEILGNRNFSTAHLRRLLGAGKLLDREAWILRLDSLARAYAERGYPAAELESASLVDVGGVPTLQNVELDEGPRVVMGRLIIRPEEDWLPDPAVYLPEGRMVEQGFLEQGLLELLRELEETGRPLSSLRLAGINLWPDTQERLVLDLELRLDHALEIRPGEVYFQGQQVSRPRTLLRISRLKAGRLYDPRRIREARRRLLATGWFREVRGPLLCRGPEGHLLLVELEELPSYRFEGLAGLLPPEGEGQPARFSFHLEFKLSNILGTGRRLDLLASRPDGISQELRFAYREPFLLGSPLGAGIELAQQVQDSSWLRRSAAFDLDWEVLPGVELGARISSSEVLPDSSAGYVLLGIDRSRSISWASRVRADRRNDPRNPRRGWTAEFLAELLDRRLLEFRGLPARGENRNLRRRRMAFAAYIPLGRSLVAAPALAGGTLSGADPPLEEHFSLGGARGPRGYREGIFRGEDFALAQAELRWLFGPASRAALFWDTLLWEQGGSRRLRHGLGLAVVLPVRHGQLELQYALGEERRLMSGLLHLRLLSRF